MILLLSCRQWLPLPDPICEDRCPTVIPLPSPHCTPAHWASASATSLLSLNLLFLSWTATPQVSTGLSSMSPSQGPPSPPPHGTFLFYHPLPCYLLPFSGSHITTKGILEVIQGEEFVLFQSPLLKQKLHGGRAFPVLSTGGHSQCL